MPTPLNQTNPLNQPNPNPNTTPSPLQAPPNPQSPNLTPGQPPNADQPVPEQTPNPLSPDPSQTPSSPTTDLQQRSDPSTDDVYASATSDELKQQLAKEVLEQEAAAHKEKPSSAYQAPYQPNPVPETAPRLSTVPLPLFAKLQPSSVKESPKTPIAAEARHSLPVSNSTVKGRANLYGRKDPNANLESFKEQHLKNYDRILAED